MVTVYFHWLLFISDGYCSFSLVCYSFLMVSVHFHWLLFNFDGYSSFSLVTIEF